jgi:hypothetical protein
MDWLATIGVGLGVAALVGVTAHRASLQSWQWVTGAALGGCLAGLAAADLLIDGAGPYWADHPMLAAGLGAVLLLGLTIVVIDAAIERGNTLRRREAAKTPVKRVLERADEAHCTLESALRGDSSDAAVVREAGEALNAAVIAARTMTPLLLSSQELLTIYDNAEAFAHDADEVVLRCRTYRRESAAESVTRQSHDTFADCLSRSQRALEELRDSATRTLRDDLGDTSPRDASMREAPRGARLDRARD